MYTISIIIIISSSSSSIIVYIYMKCFMNYIYVNV